MIRGSQGRTYTFRLRRKVRDLIIARTVEHRAPTFCILSGSGDRRKSMQHLGVVATAPATRGTHFCKKDFAGAQEVLKPAVSSSPFGHFWGWGQK